MADRRNRWAMVGVGLFVGWSVGGSAMADSLLIAGDSNPPVDQMTGNPFDVVKSVDTRRGTPTLEELMEFDAVLAYTIGSPANAVLLGNVLADYVDEGGVVGIFSYGMSDPWWVRGRIQTPGYNPFKIDGSRKDVSGTVNAVLPNDAVFNSPNKIDVEDIRMFHNINFAVPQLADGATLLADDGASQMLLALNADGNVIAGNLFPATSPPGNNEEFYNFLVNIMARADGGGAKCSYKIAKSKAKRGCESCPSKGDAFQSEASCEKAKDCRKKVKTTIGCPQGKGACKIKAKKRKCE